MKKLLINLLFVTACHQADYSAGQSNLVACPQGACKTGYACLRGYCVPDGSTRPPAGSLDGGNATADASPMQDAAAANDAGSAAGNDAGPAGADGGQVSTDSGVSPVCRSLVLDGTGWVDLGSSQDNLYNIETNFTLAAWVWPARGISNAMTLWGLESFVADTPGDNTGVRLQLGIDLTVHGYFGTASGANTIASGMAVTAETWSHVAFVRDGSDVKLYVNGNEQATTDTASAQAVNWLGSIQDHQEKAIGRARSSSFDASFDAYFQGRLAGAGVWKRPLTAIEIGRLYQRAVDHEDLIAIGPVSDAQAYYALNEGEVSIANTRDHGEGELQGTWNWSEDAPYCP